MESKPLTAAEQAEVMRCMPDSRGVRVLAYVESLEAELAEARWIARRLAVIVTGSTMTHEQIWDTLAAFDALHWPDPKTGRLED